MAFTTLEHAAVCFFLRGRKKRYSEEANRDKNSQLPEKLVIEVLNCELSASNIKEIYTIYPDYRSNKSNDYEQ
jgi:hypothetical protein